MALTVNLFWDAIIECNAAQFLTRSGRSRRKDPTLRGAAMSAQVERGRGRKGLSADAAMTAYISVVDKHAQSA